MTDLNILLQYSKQFQTSNLKNKYGTHMPFIYYTKENRKILFFDILINNVWKLHLYDFELNKIIQINTPSKNEKNINECNPNVYIDKNNNYILSYIYAPTINGYRSLVIGKSKDLINFKWEQKTDKQYNFVCLNNQYNIISEDINGQQIDIYNKKNILKYQVLFKYYILARVVNYLGDNNKLFISFYSPNNLILKTYTFLIDLKNPDVQYMVFLKDGSFDPYKCVIDPYTLELYFTHRKSEEFEDRELMCTNQFELKKTDINWFQINKY